MASPNFYTSSPTVVLPSPQPAQFVGNHYSPFVNGSSNTFAASMTANASNQPALTSSLAGRKRSRGDITAPDDDDDDDDDASTPTSIGQQNEGSMGDCNHVHAEIAMVDSGLASTGEFQASTSTGQCAHQNNGFGSHAKRPSMSSRKSQRTNTSASGQDHLAQLVLPSSMREATTEPLIDEATRVLGISWARMDSTEALRINQAAYQKWIQNHYPGLQDVNIWFENSAIPGYLVWAVNSYTTQQGWYIFSNDLTEARMVTTEAPQLVPRLQMLPAPHLAAPGGQIHAETDPVPMAHSMPSGAEGSLLQDHDQSPDTAPSEAGQSLEPMGICAAHQMALD